MAGFGGAVKLTGESEYRKALNQITQNLKEVSSEMKLVSAQYDKNDKSTEALSAQTDVLNKKLDQQKSKVELLKKQYSDMAKQYDENKAKNDALAKKYDEEKSKLSNLEKSLGTTSAEYKEQAELVAELESALEKSEKAQDSNAKSMSNLRTQINNAEADLAKTSKEIKNVGDNADDATSGIGTFHVALGNLVADVLSSAISKMQELVTNTIDVGATFEKSMSNVQAISGATDEELKMLSDTAKKFGSTTKFSASESADALSYMALAGWDAQTSCEALGGVLNLASASGMDLASASDMVTDYLSAFGLTAQDSARFADLLAYAQGNANTTAEGLGEAYKNCSANLASAGQDIETTTALLSMLANQGLKGSEAGTALTAVVRDMTSKMKDGKIAIGDTSIAVQDSQGNFRDLSDILKDVENATNGMGTAQKASALQSTFTADSIKGLNLILNAGVDEANAFEEQLRNCSGTAETMASTMNDNLSGDLTSLNSQIEGVQISLYEKFEPALRAGVDALSGLASGLQWLIDNGDTVSAVVGGVAVAVGTFMAIVKQEAIVTAFTGAITGVKTAFLALNATMAANPIGLVVAGIAGLVTAFTILWNKSESFREFWIGLWDTIKSVAEPIIDGIVTAFTTAWDLIKGVWDTVSGFFSDLWGNISNTFSSVKDFFSGKFSDAWNAIKNIFSNVGNFFGGIWNTIKDKFSSLGTNIGDAIGGAVKSGINSVIGLVEGTINNAIKLINGAIGLINKLPGVNVGKINNLSLPRLAKGGVVNGATIAEIGEAGAEAVVPLENNTQWITKVAEQMAKALIVPMTNVAKSVTAPTEANTSSLDTVEAFKEALGQMKIVLDDEEMGHFVEKTVADAIYT